MLMMAIKYKHDAHIREKEMESRILPAFCLMGYVANNCEAPFFICGLETRIETNNNYKYMIPFTIFY